MMSLVFTVLILVVYLLVLIHNVFNAAAYPFSGALSNGVRLGNQSGSFHLEGKNRKVEKLSGN